MDIQNILNHCDHTLLTQTATFDEVKTVLDDAIKYRTASACIPPCYVKQAKEYVRDRLKICTVIGFPNGYQTTDVKLFEACEAIEEGADEIDMVMNIGQLKAGNQDYVREEIERVKGVCEERGKALDRKIILKVIIETCLLTEEEKITMCRIVTDSGADYIKTSTGFSKAGATKEDILLFSSHIGEGVKMKAAGGISSLEDAQAFLSLGCDRLGTSRIVKIAKEREEKN